MRKLALLLAFLAVCYLAFLGHYPLVDPDEPVYGEAGRLMALSHNFAAWWTPHYNGQMWFDKPPMTYWLVGLSMKLFGATEFAARLPMALAGLLLVFFTARLTWRLYPESPTAPLWAALISGTTVQTLILTHACVTDMLLATCLTASLLGVMEWLSTARWTPILCAGVAIGIATLVKGPVAIVLVGAQLLLYLLTSRNFRAFFSWQIWASLAVALTISAPWFASMVFLHGRYFIDSFLEAQNVGRYLSAEHRSTSSPLFFVPVLLIGFMPWTFALIPALGSSFQRARRGRAGDIFALIWIALVFAFFSASQSKLVTYIYPLQPLAACVTAYWCARAAQTRLNVVLGSFAIAIAIAIVAAGEWYGWRGHPTLDLYAFDLFMVVIFVIGLIAFVSRGILKADDITKAERGLQSFVLIAPAGIIVIAFAVFAAGPVWRHPDPRVIAATDIAREVARNSSASDTIYSLTFNKPSLVYYSGRNIVFTDKQEWVGPALALPPYPLCVTSPATIRELQQKRLLAPYIILARSGAKVVLLECKPHDRGGRWDQNE